MAGLINAVQSQVDWDKWDKIIELVYQNMLLRIRLLNVEERKEHEQKKH